MSPHETGPRWEIPRIARRNRPIFDGRGRRSEFGGPTGKPCACPERRRPSGRTDRRTPRGHVSEAARPQRPRPWRTAGLSPQGPRHLAELDLGAGERHRPRLRRRAARGSACSAATRSPSSARTGRGSTGRSWRRRRSARSRCRSMRTPWPTRWPMCWSTPSVRFAVVAGPGAGRQDALHLRSRCRKLERIFYDEPRGLRDYDHARLHAIDDVIEPGPRAPRHRPAHRQGARRRDRRRQGLRHLDHPLHLRHHRPLQGRDALRRALHRGRERHGGVRQADRPRRGDRLSAARLGRRPLSQLCAGAGRGLLHQLPGEPGDRASRTCARSARPSTSRRRACSRTC